VDNVEKVNNCSSFLLDLRFSQRWPSRVSSEMWHRAVRQKFTDVSRYVPPTSSGSPCFLLVACLANSSTLKMETVRPGETSVKFYWTTRRHFPEHSSLHFSLWPTWHITGAPDLPFLVQFPRDRHTSQPGSLQASSNEPMTNFTTWHLYLVWSGCFYSGLYKTWGFIIISIPVTTQHVVAISTPGVVAVRRTSP
jgi:hypothetical protein